MTQLKTLRLDLLAVSFLIGGMLNIIGIPFIISVTDNSFIQITTIITIWVGGWVWVYQEIKS